MGKNLLEGKVKGTGEPVAGLPQDRGGVSNLQNSLHSETIDEGGDMHKAIVAGMHPAVQGVMSNESSSWWPDFVDEEKLIAARMHHVDPDQQGISSSSGLWPKYVDAVKEMHEAIIQPVNPDLGDSMSNEVDYLWPDFAGEKNEPVAAGVHPVNINQERISDEDISLWPEFSDTHQTEEPGQEVIDRISNEDFSSWPDFTGERNVTDEPVAVAVNLDQKRISDEEISLWSKFKEHLVDPDQEVISNQDSSSWQDGKNVTIEPGKHPVNLDQERISDKKNLLWPESIDTATVEEHLVNPDLEVIDRISNRDSSSWPDSADEKNVTDEPVVAGVHLGNPDQERISGEDSSLWPESIDAHQTTTVGEHLVNPDQEVMDRISNRDNSSWPDSPDKNNATDETVATNMHPVSLDQESPDAEKNMHQTISIKVNVDQRERISNEDSSSWPDSAEEEIIPTDTSEPVAGLTKLHSALMSAGDESFEEVESMRSSKLLPHKMPEYSEGSIKLHGSHLLLPAGMSSVSTASKRSNLTVTLT